MSNKKTLIVGTWAGPGTGKSFLRAELFTSLIKEGIHTEEVTEFAKDLTYSQRFTTLKNQPYVVGKQLNKIYSVLGQVDVIVTDSPFLLSSIYGSIYPAFGVNEYFHKWLLEVHKSLNTLDFFVERNLSFGFKQEGRNQNLKESIAIDSQILSYFIKNNLAFEVIDKNDPQHLNKAIIVIKARLEKDKELSKSSG